MDESGDQMVMAKPAAQAKSIAGPGAAWAFAAADLATFVRSLMRALSLTFAAAFSWAAPKTPPS
jgi:hypothetical protein